MPWKVSSIVSTNGKLEVRANRRAGFGLVEQGRGTEGLRPILLYICSVCTTTYFKTQRFFFSFFKELQFRPAHFT